MNVLVHFIGFIAALFIIVLLGDWVIAHLRDWHMHRRRDRLARKYGFVEWQQRKVKK